MIDTHIVPISKILKSESLLKKLVPVLRLSPFYQNMVLKNLSRVQNGANFFRSDSDIRKSNVIKEHD